MLWCKSPKSGSELRGLCFPGIVRPAQKERGARAVDIAPALDDFFDATTWRKAALEQEF